MSEQKRWIKDSDSVWNFWSGNSSAILNFSYIIYLSQLYLLHVQILSIVSLGRTTSILQSAENYWPALVPLVCEPIQISFARPIQN